MKNNQPFWFVWCEEAGVPRYKHYDYGSALTEAKRLARNNRGREFVVLSSQSSVCVDDVKVVDISPDPDQIPF